MIKWVERKNIKLREKRLRTSSWRRKGDNSNGFLLEGFKVGGICRCPDEVIIVDIR